MSNRITWEAQLKFIPHDPASRDTIKTLNVAEFLNSSSTFDRLSVFISPVSSMSFTFVNFFYI